MIRSDSNLARFLDKCFLQMNKRFDIFLVISGAEGVGKSRGLFLNIADYWFKTLLKKESIDKSAINVSVDKFVNCLYNSDKFSFVGLDEAGDSMDSRDWANKFNKVLYQAYTIIREKFIFSVVVLPSFFDLSPRFRRRRVRFLIDVTKRVDNRCKKCKTFNTRGKLVPFEFVGDKCPKCGSSDFLKGYVTYDIYDRPRIGEILQRNQFKMIKKVSCGVTPITSGVVGEYEGEFADFYSDLKTKKMDSVLEKLMKVVEPFSDTKKKPKCDHRWRYNKTENRWWCRKCGKCTKINPYYNAGAVSQKDNNSSELSKEKKKGVSK